MRWIKRTTQYDIDYALSLTDCCSIGGVGEVMVDRKALPELTLEQIVEQFGLVYSQYDFNATPIVGSSGLMITGRTTLDRVDPTWQHSYTPVFEHTVLTDDIDKGLFELKRRLDFDVT